jgi:anti-sigma B factor antagonist
MKVKDSLEGEVVVISLSGRLMAGEELTTFQGKVHYYLDLNKKQFVVDFDKVEWSSSAGIGALIAAYTSVKKADGKLVLANITNIRNLLNMVHLLKVFTVYDSLKEAMDAVRQ